MTAYGYIRKSVVHDPARMLSPETQEAAIRRLAEANGDSDVTILSDLDVSGRKGRSRRPGWDELLSAVEDGEAHAVYAYSLSRFARSTRQLLDFFELCGSRKVPIRMDRDHIDTSSAMGEMVATILAAIVSMEANVASERVKDAFAAKRAKDPTWEGPGQKPYGSREGEDPKVVVEAFHEAGSYDGAARLLNARGVPSRFSRGHSWSGSVVRGVVKAHAPSEVGPYVRRGAPAGRRTFRLAGLIECSTCHKPLTGSRDTRRGDVRYSCSRARVTPHARGWVNESKLLPVVQAEAERAAIAVRRLQVGSAEDEAALASLAAERERVKTMFRKGHVDEAELDAAMVEIADAESRLSTRHWIRRVALPPVIADWTNPEDGSVVKADDPGKVNAYLRRLFVRATVDMSQPALRGPSSWVPSVDFEWRDPSMRGEPDEDAA